MKKLISLILLLTLLSTGVLAVNTFVTENGNYKVSIDIQKGWNLVYAFDDDTAITSDSEIQFSNIKSRWLFSPLNQKFYDITSQSIESGMRKAESDTGTGISERMKYFGNTGVWFYSDKVGKLKFMTSSVQPLNQIFLKKGWNIVSITTEFVGHYIYDIKGTCEFEQIYGWDAGQQTWAWKAFSSVGFAQVIKVSNDCYLGLNTQ